MAEEKYTMREFLNDVTAIEGVSEKVKAYAEAEIAKLDKRNADRKAKGSATAKANAPLKEAIVKYVEANPGKTAKEIAGALTAEGTAMTPAKVSSLATQLKNEGVLVAAEVKADKRKVLAYTKP